MLKQGKLLNEIAQFILYFESSYNMQNMHNTYKMKQDSLYYRQTKNILQALQNSPNSTYLASQYRTPQWVNFNPFLNNTLINYIKAYQICKNCNGLLQNLKFFQFPVNWRYNEPRLDEKILKIFHTFNVYAAFVFSMADLEETNKFPGKQPNAFTHYIQYQHEHTENMVRMFNSIKKYKQDLIKIKDSIKQFQLNNNLRSYNYSIDQIVEKIREGLHSTKEIRQITSLIKAMPFYIKNKIQIPTKDRLAPNLANQQFINEYDLLRFEIHSLYINYNSVPVTYNQNYGEVYSTQAKNANMYGSPNYGITYDHLINFVNRLYATIQNTEANLHLNDKMSLIQRIISNYSICTSSSISPEFIEFSKRINEYINKCLEYVQVSKDRRMDYNQIYTFSLKDLEGLTDAVYKLKQREKNQQLKINDVQTLSTFSYFSDQVTRLFQDLKKQKHTIFQNQADLLQQSDLYQRVKKITDIFKWLVTKADLESSQIEILGQDNIYKYPNTQKNLTSPISSKGILMGDYDYQLDKKQQIIKSLEEKIKNIAGQKTMQQHHNLKLQKQIKKLQAVISQQDKNLAEKQKSINYLNETLDNNKKILIQQQNNKKSSMADIEKSKIQSQQQRDKYRTLYQNQKLQKERISGQKVSVQKQLQDLGLKKVLQETDTKKKYEQKIQQLSKQKSQLQSQLQTLKEKAQKDEKRQMMFESESKRLKEQCQTTKQKFLENINNQQNKFKTEMKTVNQYYVQTTNISDQLDKKQNLETKVVSKEQVQKLQAQCKQLNQKMQGLTDIQHRLSTELSQMKKQNQVITDKLAQQIKEKELLLKKLQTLQQKLEVSSKEIESSKVQSQEYRSKINQLEVILREKESLLKEPPSRESELNSNLPTMPRINTSLPELVPYSHILFNSDIFQNDEEYKTTLVNHIENYSHTKIFRTTLVHKYDIRNKENFHLYIDGVKNLAVVIKTQCAVIAGFYPGLYNDKEMMSKGGLLISVNNNQSYTLSTKKPGDNSKVVYRGMIYDSYFAIFGNAEIRVKTGLKTVFSNFGVNNAFFNSRGDRVDKFLCEGDKREVQFEYCEFYQVFLENQKINY